LLRATKLWLRRHGAKPVDLIPGYFTSTGPPGIQVLSNQGSSGP